MSSHTEQVKRLAAYASRPYMDIRQPKPTEPMRALPAPVDKAEAPLSQGVQLIQFEPGTEIQNGLDSATQDLYVWFEDTTHRNRSRRRKPGIAGLPECLLPYAQGLRVLERRYVDGHLHLLSAARIRCLNHYGQCVSALYTAALSVGTIAWIGTGEQYAKAWGELYPQSTLDQDPEIPDFPSEI